MPGIINIEKWKNYSRTDRNCVHYTQIHDYG